MTRRHVRRVALATLLAGAVAACGGGLADEAARLVADDRSGGDVTAAAVTRNAFGIPAPGLTRQQRRVFELGDSFFTSPWVAAPASTTSRDGLGPLLNANACAACHVRDGRAAPPDGELTTPGLLLKLAVVDGDGTSSAHPVYGRQLQDQALPMLEAEGTVVVRTELVAGEYGDGTPYELSRPSYDVLELSDGPLGDGAVLSPRIAPQVVGLGLLEAIPAEDVVAAADPEDADGDGISGRPNTAIDLRTGEEVLGRFGWKATTGSLADQAAEAFVNDMGITSSVLPAQECTAPSTGCADDVGGGDPTPDDPEVDDARLEHVTFYTRTLAVPAMRDVEEPEVAAGAEAFLAANCAACHTPEQRTGASDVEALAGQVFHPYTDLLLHDMGEGLADGRPDGDATGSEWRTPPLWGLGLVESINGHTRFLHDGRARSLEEAVLWHGGEAAASRDAFLAMDAATRSELLTFLEAL